MSKKRLVALLAAAAMLASSSSALAAGETEIIGADTAAVVSVAEDAAPDVADVAVQETAVEDEAAVLAEDGTGINWTANEIEISNLEDLKTFRDTVNNGRDFSGQTIKLTNDIDLNGENWTPIGKSGNSFKGVFDGQKHKIENLNISELGMSDVGFFGFTQNGEVKNFTINNANIKGYLDVGVVAGTPYTSKYSNIKVTGDIIVNGYAYVGGAFGKNAYANITNVDVLSNEGSYVRADSEIYRTYVGGLVGFMGEGNQIVSDCDVKIDVIGTVCDIGGILGILHYGNTLKDCTFEGSITLDNDLSKMDPGDETEFGVFAGTVYNGNNEAEKANRISNCTAELKSAVNCGNDVTDTVTPYGNFYYRYNPTKSTYLYVTTVNGRKTIYSNNIDESEICENIGSGNYLDGNTVKSVDEVNSNNNLTNEEKVEIINKVQVEDKDSAAKVADVIKSLPTDVKETIPVDTIKNIANADDSIKNSDEEKIITAIAVNPSESANKVAQLEVKKNDNTTSLKQPEGVNAVYFEVKLSDENGDLITKTDVPVYIEIDVGADNAANVNNVLREHDGVVSSLPFSKVDDDTIAMSSAKFSDFVVVMNQDIADGSAVLGFYENTAADDNTAVFDMYLTAKDNETLDKFESGEFEFIKTGTSGAEFTPADNLTIEYNEESGLYKVFRKDGSVTYPRIETKDGKPAIKLGTVTLTGIGSGSITTDKIKMYRHSKDGENLAVAIPTSPMATVSYEIKPSYTDLTVEVSYPNNITNNETAYQDMKITVAGADFSETYKLGKDASGNVSFENNAYTLKISDKLIKNTAYTVTVEGAGYRTARYTVNMTGNKTLKFWNNVLDNAQAIEYDENGAAVAGARTTKTTFLAGDIVADNTINIYDLSAVVSYFGTTGLNASNYPQYAKYDLNRDGKIDSKDIAYVLVSWGE